ncbi:PUA-like domain-containing protein [Leptodontidium sp. MPI-SDFR-AT-0119]|nr:PUA-like domain-containing protein [Leptodontidium sp. MPI-SDFR-AT-0119]
MLFLKDVAKKVGTACLRQVRKKEPVQMAAITGEDWDNVKLLLVTFCHLADESTTLEMIQRFQIMGILAMFTRSENGFPYPIPDVARVMKDKFQTILDGHIPISSASTSSKQPSSKSSKAMSTSKNSTNPTLNSTSEFNTETNTTNLTHAPTAFNKPAPKIKIPWRKAPSDHDIFGLTGIMHHILIRQDITKSYCIDPTFTSTVGSVIGHNGFTIGAWFPRQLAMIRDGMHNLPMGGIAGNSISGAYSVVVASSNAKGGKDIDHGNTIYYSSTLRSSDSLNNGSRILNRSIETGNPIRVIRKSTCDFVNRPVVGYRYEGLFKAVSIEEKNEDEEGGEKVFWSLFRLERVHGQVGFDLNRPTEGERMDYKRVDEGY